MNSRKSNRKADGDLAFISPANRDTFENTMGSRRSSRPST